jgi:hypothetical protein
VLYPSNIWRVNWFCAFFEKYLQKMFTGGGKTRHGGAGGDTVAHGGDTGGSSWLYLTVARLCCLGAPLRRILARGSATEGGADAAYSEA